MKQKVVLSVHIADALLSRGHRIVSVKPSNKVQGRAAFVFNRSPEFDRDLSELMRKQ